MKKNASPLFFAPPGLSLLLDTIFFQKSAVMRAIVRYDVLI